MVMVINSLFAFLLWVDIENVVILSVRLIPGRISVVDVDVDSAGLVQALSRGALRSSGESNQENDLQDFIYSSIMFNVQFVWLPVVWTSGNLSYSSAWLLD